MPLLKQGRLIEDRWVFIGDDADIPVEGDIVVSFERLKSSIEILVMRNGNLGVTLDNDASVHELAPYIKNLAMIALEFPAFTDGRAYSQARILTTQLGFTGELRATGNVLADQGVFMSRCGFDSFETDARQPPHLWLNLAGAMSLAYQKSYRAPDGVSQRAVVASRVG